MGTLNEDLTEIKKVEDTIIANKVARFAYTDEAYTKNIADGVPKYNVNNAQNIPTADPSVLKVNDTVLSQGYRAQASSITRMLMNHFLGRLSYNVNKVNDGFSNLVATLIKHRGTANGFATLDENGRVPYSQLPESAVGDVKTVNNISPVNGNIPLTGENIPVSSTDPTLLSAPLTTNRYANSSVTTEKIADNAVTNAKIKDPISVAKGGTGATDAKAGFMNLANGLVQGQNPQDAEYMIYKSGGGTWGLYTLLQFWEYIKTKIDLVLGVKDFSIEFNRVTKLKDTGGYIDFHYNGDTSDYTSRIIENTKGILNINGVKIQNSYVSATGFTGELFGNASTADTATNATTAYKGMVHTCSTAKETKAKTVSITGFTLTTGACIRVLFANGNSVAYPTLNVNGTGAKEIRVKQGSEYVPLSAENGALGQGAYSWDSNTLLELRYNGTYWIANENAIVHEKLNSELGYLSSRVFINGRKEIWGGTSSYDIAANESKVMTISSDLPINDDISNHSLSVITEIESTYVNAYGDIKLMDNYLKFSIYSRNLTNNSYLVKTVHIFVTGY